MKKILLGLFILGTLGIAQSNYEVYVKSGVKISQSEVDRDSKEIENLVNKEIIERYNTESKEIEKIINDKIISKYNNEGKKVIMEKSKKLYNEYLNDLINNIINDVPKN